MNPNLIVTRSDFTKLLSRHLTPRQRAEVRAKTKFLLEDPRFFRLPASTFDKDKPAKHHGWFGGLAAHVYEVLDFSLCAAAAARGRVDLLVLATGAILHDMGKLPSYLAGENTADGAWCIHATPGVSHIMHGLAMWGSRCRQPMSEQDLHILHLIASHHGRREWGSPEVPQTLEALILHSADMQSLMLNGAPNPALRP